MKLKRKVSVFGIVVLLMISVSCKKDNSSANDSVIDNEKVKIGKAFELSQAFDDTLIMVYDTVKIPSYNHYCMKYDKLYHQNDSMFNIHYSMFGDELYKYGMMLSNYSPSAGMMQGGMMNSGSLDMKQMMGDTATVGGYYRNMQQLHSKHSTYHNRIYN